LFEAFVIGGLFPVEEPDKNFRRLEVVGDIKKDFSSRAPNNAGHFVLGGFFMHHSTFSEKFFTWGASAPE